MTEQDQLAIIQQGREVWNQWRQEHHSIQPDFSGVDFTGAHLSEAILSQAVLSDADFAGAILTGAEVTGADFSRADFSGVDFSKANTHRARLGKAYFSRRSETLLDESYQQSLRADTQMQQGKQRAGFDVEDLDERVHMDWANEE